MSIAELSAEATRRRVLAEARAKAQYEWKWLAAGCPECNGPLMVHFKDRDLVKCAACGTLYAWS